jgi:hypothetical protein
MLAFARDRTPRATFIEADAQGRLVALRHRSRIGQGGRPPQRSLSIWTARGSSGGMAAGRVASGTEQRTPPLAQDEFVTLPREWTDLGAARQLAKRCPLE